MVLLSLIKGFGVLGALRRLEIRLLRPGKVLIEDFLLDAFVRLRGRLMASKTVNIPFFDSGQKVESGFSLYNDGLLDGLLPGILLTTILLCLSTDGGL